MTPRSLTLGLLAVGLAAGAAQAGGQTSAGIEAYAKQRYSQAATLLHGPALAGDPVAEAYLGFMYFTGRGLPRNNVEAARWFALAAQQGEPDAQFYLGCLYDRGLGVEHDFVEAYKWLDLAVGHANSRQIEHWTQMRDNVANKLSEGERAQAEARARAFTPIP